MKKAIRKGDIIEVQFYVPKVAWLRTLEYIKSFKGRLFHADKKIWTVPYTLENQLSLEKNGFELGKGFESLVRPPEELIRPPEHLVPIDESKLGILPYMLRDYQLEAIQFAEGTGWRCMLSLAPRMGKTVCSLVAPLLHKEFLPMVIVTTVSGKSVWEQEIKTCVGSSSVILQGQTPYKIEATDYIILNFDILYFWKDTIKSLAPKYIVFDESHKCATPTMYQKKKGEEKGRQIPVKVTEAFTQLSNVIPHVVLLTGTPITTGVQNFQTQLAVLDESSFGNRYKYLHRWCDPKMGNYGWEYKGFTNRQDFIDRMSKVVFRRTKEQCFNSLPEETHEMYPIEIDKESYRKELLSLQKWLEKNPSTTEDEISEKLSHFDSISYSAKSGAIKQWVKDFLETSDEKLVVYTWYKLTTLDLYESFKKESVMVYGATTSKERQKNIDSFANNPKVRVFIANIRSCSEAISLATSNTCFYAELPLTPAALAQSKERIWMPSIQKKRMFYIYAVAKDTVDTTRVSSLQSRAKLIGTVLDGKEEEILADTVKNDVLHSIKDKQ